MKGRCTAVGLAGLTLSVVLLAHEDHDPQAPLPSPALSGGGSVAFSSNGIALRSWIPVTDFNSSYTGGNDCWGYTSGSGREYALMGLTGGTAFVEVTDPGAPQIIAVESGPTSTWRDIKTYQDHAYAVSEGGGGIQIFDLSMIDSGVVTNVGSVTGGGCTDDSHNVVIDTTSGFLYRVGGSGSPCSGGGPQGLVAYDLSNPASPSYAGAWNNRYVHDAQVVTWDLAGPWFGKQLAFCAANDTSGGGTEGLDIVDVTNKASMTLVSSTTYANSAFSHQCWLSSDKQYVYLNDELDEASFGSNQTTRIFDVSDLANPFVAGTFSSGTTSIDHNLYTKGNTIYEANYRSGLRVFDATNPLAPVQVAWFDTYPDDDNAQFNSLWSNYPDFPSGTIIGSDIEKGMFVWTLGDPLLTFSHPDGLPSLVDPSGGTLKIQVNEHSPGDLLAGSVQFHVDTGSGFTSTPLSATGGGLVFEAPLPPSTCGGQIKFYVSAKSTDGTTWSHPVAGPTQVHFATSAVAEKVMHFDDVEVDLGWTVGDPSDDATTGIWTRVDPIGTGAQAEDDHTPTPGVFAWVTGQGTPGGSIGENDVDSGKTTLFSPLMDASGLTNPYIEYWRWFYNTGGVDPLIIDISNDGGSSWMNLETVGPTGNETTGGWIRHRAAISGILAPTNQMQLRIVAADYAGSIVEAGFDDIRILEYVCSVGISGIVPAKGPFRGGNTVTITGEGFLAGVTTVDFGSRRSKSVTVLSDTQLQAVVPPAPRSASGQKGLGRVDRTVDVTVTTGVGSATFEGAYTYRIPKR